MPNQAKSVMIGIFVVAACALIIFILMFLHPTVGDNAKTLRVRFGDVDKVNIGTRVTYAGRPVGEVVEIKEVENARHEHINHKGEVYVYELTLKVDSSVDVFNIDEIAVRTSGLLGEKNIAIIPTPIKPGDKVYKIENQIIYGVPTGSVEDAFKEFGNLARKFDKALDNIIDVFDEIKKDRIVENIGATMKNFKEITGAINKPDEWESTLANVHHFSERLNTSMDSVDKTLDEFHTGSISFRDMTGKGNDIIAGVGRGEGSLGHILVGDDLYLRLTSILSKGETAMDDVNQYGVLFHTNKRWQRRQAQRMNLMAQLSTPQAFSRYFNEELNQINSSLNRVSLVLSENDYECYPQYLMQNPEFINKFADLLKKFDKMEEDIKMYNQQLVNAPCEE